MAKGGKEEEDEEDGIIIRPTLGRIIDLYQSTETLTGVRVLHYSTGHKRKFRVRDTGVSQ